jgi:hypothetical protein
MGDDSGCPIAHGFGNCAAFDHFFRFSPTQNKERANNGSIIKREGKKLTYTQSENIIIRYCGGADEGVIGGEGRTECQALVATLSEMAPEHRFTPRPEGVGTTASGMRAWELLERSGLNYERSSWYVADATPEGSNRPPG